MLQRAWRAHKAPAGIDPVAAMYLERLDKYAPSLMKRNGFCDICGEEWGPGHGRGKHMARALAFREDFAPYFRESVVPTLVWLESERRTLQSDEVQIDDDTQDEKVAAEPEPDATRCAVLETVPASTQSPPHRSFPHWPGSP